jgi:hypothetical protein
MQSFEQKEKDREETFLKSEIDSAAALVLSNQNQSTQGLTLTKIHSKNNKGSSAGLSSQIGRGLRRQNFSTSGEGRLAASQSPVTSETSSLRGFSI